MLAAVRRNGTDWTIWRQGALDAFGDGSWASPVLAKAVVDRDRVRVTGGRTGERQAGEVVIICDTEADVGDMVAEGDQTASQTPAGGARQVAVSFKIRGMAGEELWQLHLAG